MPGHLQHSARGAKGMDTGLMNAHFTDRVLVEVEDIIHMEEWDVVNVVVKLCSVAEEERM